MPETMSVERRKMLKLLGAELVLTDGARRACAAPSPGPKRSLNEIPNAVIPQQFQNPANPEIHRRTTAEEIWDDTDGEIDVFVAGVGTGGTITGVGAGAQGAEAGVAGWSRSSRRTSRCFRAATPGRTRSRGSAPASCRRSSTPRSMTR